MACINHRLTIYFTCCGRHFTVRDWYEHKHITAQRAFHYSVHRKSPTLQHEICPIFSYLMLHLWVCLSYTHNWWEERVHIRVPTHSLCSQISCLKWTNADNFTCNNNPLMANSKSLLRQKDTLIFVELQVKCDPHARIRFFLRRTTHSWSPNTFHYSITTEKQKLVILH